MSSRILSLQTFRRATAATAVIAGWVLAQPASASQLLTAETEFFTGSMSQTVLVDTPGAGTVTVSLTDLGWPTMLKSLSFFASTDSSVLQSSITSTPTQFMYSLTGPLAFYAHLSAQADGLSGFPGLPDFGLYSMQISFTPAVSAVPLPTSFPLMVTGLLGVVGCAWLMRRTRGAPGNSSTAPTAVLA